MTTLHVSAIEPARLEAIRATGHDERANPLAPFPAAGWEPLRCCLVLAPLGEAIVLIFYAPFAVASPWTETGPVFVHLQKCPGYDAANKLPAALRTGPRILRTYHADGSLDYADITVAETGQDIEELLLDLFDRPAVDTVHVRALAAQCFTYAVTRGA